MNPEIESGIDLESPPQRGVNLCIRRLLTAILLFALLEGLVILGLFHRLDLVSYDWVFRIRGVENPGQDVMIVAIDDASLEKLGPPPISRSMHARLLSRLDLASAVVFNMIFDASLEKHQDDLFGAAIKKHGRVVLPCAYSFSQDRGGPLEEKLNLPILPLLRNAANIGFLNIPTDDDSLVRRTTMVDVNFSPDVPVPSLGLAAVLTALHDPMWKLRGHVLDVGGYKIYMDKSNRALFNYWGPAGTIPTVSYIDVVNGKIYRECFAGKIVIVGYTDAGARDVFLTPFKQSASAARGGKMSGVEIEATIIQSLLNDGMLREMPPLIQALLLMVVILLSVFILSRYKLLQKVVLTSVFLVAVLAFIFGMWRLGWVFYPAAPLLGVLIGSFVSQSSL